MLKEAIVFNREDRVLHRLGNLIIGDRDSTLEGELANNGLAVIGEPWNLIGMNFIAALLIGYDGWKAYQRFSKGEKPMTAPATAGK